MSDTPLVDRFRRALLTLIPGFDDNEERLGLAVSGGPDSLALLLLSNAAFPDRIAAATVDHQLRPQSRAEADMVAKLCKERNIPHQILVPTIPIRGSIQAVARKSRYALLNGWIEHQNLTWLATAHHADDQLETLIMRILRGSGIDGMSGIRSKRGHIIRPLLQFSKQELQDYVAAQGIAAVDDPSNRDQSFDRVRVRDALSRLEGFNIELASQSALALDDARTAIDWMVDKFATTHIHGTGDAYTLDPADLPHEILRRLVLKCLHYSEPSLSPRGEQLENCILALKAGQTVTLGNTLCKGLEKWTFSAAPKRASP